MGTSYVEYKGFGFWTRDSSLAHWLTAISGEMGKVQKPEPWQESLKNHWEVQAAIDGGCMSAGLDDFVIDDARKNFLLTLTKRALEQVEPLGHRTGQLFIDLLEGRLRTTASDPTDYLE